MSRKRSRYKKVCIAAAAVGAASPLFGQTVSTWTAPAGGSWADAAHWSAAVPNNGTPAGATYDATVAATGSAYTVGLSSDVTLNSFTLNSAGATLAQSGGTLSAGTVNLLAGTYSATGGMLSTSTITGPAGAAINVAGPFTIQEATLGAGVGTRGGNVSVTGGGALTLTGNWFNSGTVAVNGGTLTLAGGLIYGGTVSATGGAKFGMAPGTTSGLAHVALGADVDVPATATLTLSAMTSNSGTINVNGGTVRIGSANTLASIGTIHNNGGTVLISGGLNIAGTLALNASTGPWELASNASIGGATITGNSPNNLVALGGILTGVTVAGEVTVGDGTASDVKLITSSLALGTGARLTINAPAGVSSVGVEMSDGKPVLNGAAEVVFDGAGDGGFVRASSTSITFGPALTVRTGSRGGTAGGAGNGVVNQGLMSAQTAGRTLSTQGPFTNQGTVEARNGSTLSITAGPTNLSGGTLTGGAWNVYDNATMALPAGSSVTTNAASVTLSGAGSTFAAMNALASNSGTLNLAGGKLFTTAGSLSNSGTISVGNSSAMKVVGTLTNTGKVDLAGGTLVLDYTGATPADTLRAQLALGRAGGTWAGATGVTSSTAAANEQHRIGVGYAEASALGVGNWAGVSVDSTAVVTKLTWYGDANMDSRVDADDYALLDRGYAKHLTGWVNGDFDYSGAVDAGDYLLIDRVYIQQGGTLSPTVMAEREAQFGSAYAAQLFVPEPSAVVLLAAGVPMVLRRRRS